NVLVVLPREHRIVAAHLSREERHPLVMHFRPIERTNFEAREILCFEQLGQWDLPVERGVGGVVCRSARFVMKPHKTSVFDPARLCGCQGKITRSEYRSDGSKLIS